MSFALTKFEARGVEIKTPSKKRGKQELVFTITGTTADVDLDLGDEDGTFWTDALADATYGTRATSVFAFLFTAPAIVDQVAGLMAVESEQLIDRIQKAAVSTAGEYSLAVENHLPNIAVNAADGETTWVIRVHLELNDSIYPVSASFG